MMADDAGKYLTQADVDPATMLNCASLDCRKRFVAAEGFAAEVVIGDQGVVFFFCSQACYLRDIPTDNCGRA